jgi:LuxR family maltose regulon positive regulatory protein
LNGLGYLGLATVLLGRPAEASVVAEEARALAEERAWTSLAQSAAGDLAGALVLLIRGRPADAERLLVQASAATNELLVQVAIRIAHSLLNVSQDRPHAAVRYARSARDIIAGRTVPDFVAEWLALAEAEAALAAGDPKATLSVLSRAGTDGSPPRWFAVQYAVCSARAWLALSDLPRAELALTTTSAAVEDPTNPVAAVEVWVARAVLAERLHDEGSAVDAISRAVRIAAPDGIARPFLFFDRERVPRVLGRLSGLDATEAGFVAQLRSAGLGPATGPADATSARTPTESTLKESTLKESTLKESTLKESTLKESTLLVEPLTERELAVLQLLPSMQSNLEIAEEMFVSVNTVKVHLKTLYRKLDVPNRRSAVRRSRTLGLLP